MKVKNDVQAIIIKKEGDDFLFLTIERLDRDTQESEIRFVKGGVEKGEEPEQALRREIKEEVGVTDIQHIEPLCHYSYIAGEVRHEVDVFLVLVDSHEVVSVNSSQEGGYTIKSAQWMTGEETAQKLTFEDERKLVLQTTISGKCGEKF